LALYRDWELIDVLAATVDDVSIVDQVRSLVAAGHRADARKVLQTMLAGLAADRANARDVVEALIEALSVDG
jgi:hypothetical protein